MKAIGTIQELRTFTNRLEVLQKISKSLHRSDEDACNYGLTHSQEVRKLHLLEKAQAIATMYGLVAYHQGDPRGCSLYLVTHIQADDDDYTNGVAIA